MIDPFVLLAAVLLLAVIALLRFVGCAGLLGIDPIDYKSTAPHIDSIEPQSATAGDAGFDLTVKGTNFVDTDTAKRSQVLWNGSPRNTAFDSVTKYLTASIDASDIAIDKAGTTPQVTVFNPKDVTNPNSQDVTSDNAK